jgi:hypothetical protein
MVDAPHALIREQGRPGNTTCLKDESQKRETSEMNLKKQENCELRFIYLSEQS